MKYSIIYMFKERKMARRKLLTVATFTLRLPHEHFHVCSVTSALPTFRSNVLCSATGLS